MAEEEEGKPPQGNTGESYPKTPPAIVHEESHKTQDVERDHEAEPERHEQHAEHRVNLRSWRPSDVVIAVSAAVTALATIGIFAANIVFAIFAYGQLRAVNDTIQVSQDQFAKDERPWMWVSDVQPRYVTTGGRSKQGVEVNVVFKNYGKTPAIGFHAEALVIGFADNYVPIANRVEYTIAQFLLREAHVQVVSSNPVVPPTGTVFSTPENFGYTPSQVAAIRKSDAGWVIVGKLNYSDRDGKPHWAVFCLALTSGGGFLYCPNDNQIDD